MRHHELGPQQHEPYHSNPSVVYLEISNYYLDRNGFQIIDLFPIV